MTAIETKIDDEPAAGTPFCTALRWRVRDPEEAMFIASTHRRHAAEARDGIPEVIDSFGAWSVATGREQRARSHDELAALCERHAARLQASSGAARHAKAVPHHADAARPEFDAGEQSP